MTFPSQEPANYGKVLQPFQNVPGNGFKAGCRPDLWHLDADHATDAPEGL